MSIDQEQEPEPELKLHDVPNQTAEEYIKRHYADLNFFQRIVLWPVARVEWHYDGLLQYWTTRTEFGKCRTFSAVVRGDGKVIGIPEQQDERECTNWDRFAHIENGHLKGVASKMYLYK